MPTQKTSTMPDSRSIAIDQAGALNQIQRWFATALEKGERRVRSPLLRIRPRVSLLTGSVLVLVTLYTPFATEACSARRPTEYEFMRGEGIWPGLLGALDMDVVARGFYLFALSFAAFTALLVLMSCFRAGLLRKPNLTHWLYAITGTISLFVLADLCALWVGVLGGALLEGAGASERTKVFVLFASTLAVVLRCFRSELIRNQPVTSRLFAIAGGVSVFVIADIALSVLWPTLNMADPPRAVLLAPPLLYFFTPVELWYRFGLRPGDEKRPRWLKVRPHLIVLYLPAIIATCRHFVFAVSDGVWGFGPFCTGIFFLSLGYMQLAREAALVTAPANLGRGAGDNAPVSPCGFNYLAGDQD